MRPSARRKGEEREGAEFQERGADGAACDLRAVDAERVCGGAGVPRRDGLLDLRDWLAMKLAEKQIAIRRAG